MHPLRLRYKIIKKKIRHFLKWITKLSRVSVTLMFVPHGEARILSLKLTLRTGVLIATALSFVVLWAITSINAQQTVQGQILSLERASTDIERDFAIIDQYTTTGLQAFMRLESNMRHLESIMFGIAETETVEDAIGGMNVSPELLDHAENALRTINMMDTRVQRHMDFVGGINRLIVHQREVLEHIPSLWPVPGGGRMVSPFGNRNDPITGEYRLHTGIDIVWWPGSPIRATADGEVHVAQDYGAYGLCVDIAHQYGFKSRYAHLNHMYVKRGDMVRKGQIIGLMGNTGRSVAPHLHYEVLLNDHAIDPEPFLSSKFAWQWQNATH